MTVSDILKRTSFSTLTEEQQEEVVDLFFKVGGQPISRDVKAFELDQKQLFRRRKALPVLLTYYQNKLTNTNSARFKFMNPEQREILEEDLLYTFYILYAQFQLDETEHRRQHIDALIQQINDCAKLIYELEKTPKLGEQDGPAEILLKATNDSDKPAQYCGLTIVAPFIAEKVEEFSTGGSTILKKWMGEVNGLRLYWVWGGGLLKSVIAQIPDDFARKGQAQQAVTAPAPFTGYMSWILYYARFGIELKLLLEHTIAGPWMSKKEKEIPFWYRFQTQWQQRKFALLNDSIWATCNLVCFFWWKGLGGDVFTAVLLLMDTCLNAWKFCEERANHKADMERYKEGERFLREKMEKKKQDNDLTEYNALKKRLDNLLIAKDQCAFDWQYKKYVLINDMVYAVGLLCGFILIAIGPIVPAAVVTAGAALCFVLTVACSAVSSDIEVAKSRQTTKLTTHECNERLKQFIELKQKNNKDVDEFAKRQLYLDLRQLVATNFYQERWANFQKLHLVRSVLIDALIPFVVFAAFMFFPLDIGIAAIAVGIALAIATNQIIKLFEPKADKLPVMDEEEEEKYQAFAALPNPTIGDLINKHKQEYPGTRFTGTSKKPTTDWLTKNDLGDGALPSTK